MIPMWAKILLLFFVFSFLFRTDLSFDQDLGRHLRLGEIIWETHQIPKTNLFSYTNPDFPFINTHWLFEIFVYGVNQTIGLHWMLILKILIFMASIWLVIKTIPKENEILLLPIGFIFFHVLRERLELRPEIFSFLFTAVTYYILTRNRFLYLLPVIQLLWINTHIYFFVGLALQAIFLIQKRLKKLATILILSVFVSLINPNGINGFLYPLNVTKNYGYTIVENQTMFLLENIKFSDPNFLFVKLTGGIILVSILFAFLSSRRKSGSNKLNIAKNILLSLFGLVLALMNVRSFPYLVFLSLPAVLQNFGAVPWNKVTTLLTTSAVVLLTLESFLYLNGDYYRYRADQHQVGLYFTESVKKGMDFVLTNNLPDPIYNNFDIGSYILYRGYPKYKVFVDGRPEAYPASFFHEVYIPTQSDYGKFKELEIQYNFKTIIFSHTDQTPWGKSFLQNIVKDQSWKLVYIDDFMVILTKEGMGIDLSKLSPNSYKFTNHRSYLNLGFFLLGTGYQDSGRQFILKAKELFPKSPIINQIMGNPQTNYFFW